MKKLIIALVTIVLVSCGPTIYQAQNFEKSKATVKTIAILPFVVSEDARKFPKGTTRDMISQQQEKESYDIQNSLYTWFLQHQYNYTVTFQDVDRTNALLRKDSITYDNMALKDKSELCKILGVDAVISGKANLAKGMSEGGAVAMGVLTGGFGSTNKTKITVSIYDTTNVLLWKYDDEEDGSIGSNATVLADDLANKCSKDFPYTKAVVKVVSKSNNTYNAPTYHRN